MTKASLRFNQSGSSFVIVFLAVIIVAIGGAAAFIVTKNSEKDKKQTASQTDKTPQTNKPTFTATTATTAPAITTMFKAVKAGDYDVKCTLDYGKADSSNSLLSVTGKSTLYLSGATKMRIDTTIADKPGHFMRVGNAVYIWAEGDKDGSKFPVSTKSNSSSSTSSDKLAESANKYKLSCQSVASLDSSIFVLPATVNFVDVNSQMHQQSSGN